MDQPMGKDTILASAKGLYKVHSLNLHILFLLFVLFVCSDNNPTGCFVSAFLLPTQRLEVCMFYLVFLVHHVSAVFRIFTSLELSCV